MQRIITVVIVLAAVGIVSAFAASKLVPSHQAGAAPSATQVREQNLDASGFIRTHEQGTANVSVTNTWLPVSGTVNVGNFPAAAQGRLINLGEADSHAGSEPACFLPVCVCGRVRLSSNHSDGRSDWVR